MKKKVTKFFQLTKTKVIILLIIIILAHLPYTGYHEKIVPCMAKVIGCISTKIYFFNFIFWMPFSFLTLFSFISEGHVYLPYSSTPLYKYTLEVIMGLFSTKDYNWLQAIVILPVLLFYWYLSGHLIWSMLMAYLLQ